MIARGGAAAVLALLLAGAARAGAGAPVGDRPAPAFVGQFLGGTAFSLPTTLAVDHRELGHVDHAARWETRPLKQPFYWALRLRWQRAVDGFEVQLLHHKMYLGNPTAEIEDFEVTHGFNVVTVNYLRRRGPLRPRIGLGVVVPDTESTVLGRRHGDGYAVGGPAALLGLGWERGLGRRVLVAAEAQFVAARARVAVDRGEARVVGLGLHLLVGLGVGL